MSRLPRRCRVFWCTTTMPASAGRSSSRYLWTERRSANGTTGKGLLDRDFTPTTRDGGQPSLWVYALFAVFGGLLLNVMPCVLPVIALKIFGLVKMAGDEPRRVRRLGWAFSAGILASFLVLAADRDPAEAGRSAGGLGIPVPGTGVRHHHERRGVRLRTESFRCV